MIIIHYLDYTNHLDYLDYIDYLDFLDLLEIRKTSPTHLLTDSLTDSLTDGLKSRNSSASKKYQSAVRSIINYARNPPHSSFEPLRGCKYVITFGGPKSQDSPPPKKNDFLIKFTSMTKTIYFFLELIKMIFLMYST